MGKLKIERLDEKDILFWVNIDELRVIYNQIRFGMEFVDDGRLRGNMIEGGGVRDFINKKDYKSKSKTEVEMLRRSIRDKNIKNYKNYNKDIEYQVKMDENMILGKFLYFDIISNYLVKVNFA